jgi:hypothetical protein
LDANTPFHPSLTGVSGCHDCHMLLNSEFPRSPLVIWFYWLEIMFYWWERCLWVEKKIVLSNWMLIFNFIHPQLECLEDIIVISCWIQNSLVTFWLSRLMAWSYDFIDGRKILGCTKLLFFKIGCKCWHLSSLNCRMWRTLLSKVVGFRIHSLSSGYLALLTENKFWLIGEVYVGAKYKCMLMLTFI